MSIRKVHQDLNETELRSLAHVNPDSNFDEERVLSQGASKRQSKAQPGPFLRKAQPRPVEGAVKGTLQGGLYSRHCSQRSEPDNVRKVPNPTTLGIFFPVRQNDDVPKKGPRLDSPQARPSAKQSKGQAKAHPRGDPRRVPRQSVQDGGAVWAFLYKARSRPPPYKAQLRPPCRAASILDTARKERNPTTLGKVPNPTTLGIFFPVTITNMRSRQGKSTGQRRTSQGVQSDFRSD